MFYCCLDTTDGISISNIDSMECYINIYNIHIYYIIYINYYIYIYIIFVWIASSICFKLIVSIAPSVFLRLMLLRAM